VDIDAHAARDSTASDIWWVGVRQLAVANGPNIFQMLLVLKINYNIILIATKLYFTLLIRSLPEIFARRIFNNYPSGSCHGSDV